jgi:aldehyde dehydrogenase (NAD+)
MSGGSQPALAFRHLGPGGMRRYHGRRSFETFSNMRSVMEKSILMDIHLRQSPYTAFWERMLRLLMR